MYKNRNILFAFLLCQINYGQNYLTFNPLNQQISAYFAQIGDASVVVNCNGNSNIPLSINIVNCGTNIGLFEITYSNGTSLLPGESTIIKFKFKKDQRNNNNVFFEDINYKFSLENDCNKIETLINISVKYIFDNFIPKYNQCRLPSPSDFIIQNIDANYVTCTWSNVVGINRYRLRATNMSGIAVDSEIRTEIGQSCTLFNLIPGEKYLIEIDGFEESNRPYNYRCSTLWKRIEIIASCPQNIIPTNITAIPYSYGYSIGFSPEGYYIMEYVNLSNNNSGTTSVYTGSNFFYYVSQNDNFKFRLKSFASNCALFSDWYIVDQSVCASSNYPYNLILTSQCAPSPPSNGCGAFVRWNNVPQSTGYQLEYLIYNLAGQSFSGAYDCSSNSFYISDSVSANNGQWFVKFRVKSKCVSNTWSDYSPWSATFVWS